MTQELHDVKDVQRVRDLLLKEQNNLDPLTKEKMVRPCLDHRHDSDCFVRGVLSRESNSFEGKVSGAFARYLSWMTSTSLPDVLRNLADYYEKGVDTRFRHPEYKKELTKVFMRLNSRQQTEFLSLYTTKVGSNNLQRKKIFQSLLTKKKALSYESLLNTLKQKGTE